MKEEFKKIIKKISSCKTCFIMAHENLDLDALGSSIGIYLIAKSRNKKAYIIIDDKTHELGVEKILREQEGCINIIKSDKINDYLEKNKNLLIILDTNKKNLVQSKKVLDIISDKIIIDHHETGKESIKNALILNDTTTSSTCQIITEFIEYLKLDISSTYATIILSGIVLDTNNFTLKTSSDTFYAAHYLTSMGGSAKKVQYLLKQDLDEYNERQKLMTNIETINNKVALTKASSYTFFRREDLARVADTLLFFNNIEASFVIGKISKEIVGVSVRSLGNYEIDSILTEIGGGGDKYNGAAIFKNKTINEVEKLIKKVIKEKREE